MAAIRDIVDGLNILLKYAPEDILCAEYNIIYAGPEIDENTLSEYDKEKMEALGWFFDIKVGSWAKFVFKYN